MRSFFITTLFLAMGLLAIEAQAKTASEVFDLVSRSVVVVFGLDDEGDKHSYGSGVVIEGGGIATNCHVIDESVHYTVRHQKKEYPALLRQADWDRDVCILSAAELKVPGVKLGNTNNLRVGARVYAVGAPKGLELTLADGIVSSLREIDGDRYIQTTTPISKGSSGSGLFDEEGRLVGLPTFYLKEGQQLNFAVPVEWIGQLLRTPAISAEFATTTEIAANALRHDEHAAAQQKADEAAAEVARQAELHRALPTTSEHQAEVARIVDQYRQLIMAKVRGNTRLPENVKGDLEVRCLVSLLPTGEVYSVILTQSSGDPAYDEAVVRSIKKSSPLPLPSDRDARIEFVPQLSFVHRPHGREIDFPSNVAGSEVPRQNFTNHDHSGAMKTQPPKEPPSVLQVGQSAGALRLIEERFSTNAMKVDSPRSVAEQPLLFAGFDRRPIPKGIDTINATEPMLGESPPRHHPDNLAPSYPLPALLQRAEGRALVRAEIRPDGRVGRLWVKQSSGFSSLDHAAIETVRGWRFYPAQRHGMAVAMWMDVPIEYKVP